MIYEGYGVLGNAGIALFPDAAHTPKAPPEVFLGSLFFR
jgi:hypothetical protein